MNNKEEEEEKEKRRMILRKGNGIAYTIDDEGDIHQGDDSNQNSVDEQDKRRVMNDNKGDIIDYNGMHRLEAFQMRRIKITCHNDMMGRFNDILTLDIDGFKKKYRFPVTAYITGTPVSIITNTLGISMQRDNMSQAQFSLSWGNLIAQTQPTLRVLKFNNNSPRGIRSSFIYNSTVNYRMYNYKNIKIEQTYKYCGV